MGNKRGEICNRELGLQFMRLGRGLFVAVHIYCLVLGRGGLGRVLEACENAVIYKNTYNN
jgi:hypothetical protein